VKIERSGAVVSGLKQSMLAEREQSGNRHRAELAKNRVSGSSVMSKHHKIRTAMGAERRTVRCGMGGASRVEGGGGQLSPCAPALPPPLAPQSEFCL